MRVAYLCTACRKFLRSYFIKIDQEMTYVMKVGQEPPWDIAIERDLERSLGEHTENYKKGLICESQGYGIGAFAYYRRIVEDIIDQLLNEISGLMAGVEREQYLHALEKTQKTRVAQEKIDLVKDLLPPILRPDDMNPLAVLHGVLSEGLHAESDERCLELAMQVKEVLVFLVNRIIATKVTSRAFTNSMRKILARKSGGS